MFLRRRHPQPDRAHCGDAHHRRNPEVRRGRQPRLSEHRWPASGRWLAAIVVLHVVLYRRLSGRVPAQRAGLPPARAEERRLTDRLLLMRRLFSTTVTLAFATFGTALAAGQQPAAPAKPPTAESAASTVTADQV